MEVEDWDGAKGMIWKRSFYGQTAIKQKWIFFFLDTDHYCSWSWGWHSLVLNTDPLFTSKDNCQGIMTTQLENLQCLSTELISSSLLEESTAVFASTKTDNWELYSWCFLLRIFQVPNIQTQQYRSVYHVAQCTGKLPMT